MSIVYLDGEFLPEDQAKIPALDRGFLSGDGIFTSLQVNEGTVYFLNEHISRLKQQCEVIKLICPDIQEDWAKEVVLKNQAYEGVWKMKIVMSRGQDPSMALPRQKPEHLLIFLKPFSPLVYAPMRMTLFPIPTSTAHAKVKSLAHLNRFCVMEYAKERGLDDAITQTESGKLLECSFANLFWKVEKTLYIPHPTLPYYSGLTLDMMIRCAKVLGFNVSYVESSLKEIPKEAQVYRCNTMTAIRPIIEIEDCTFSRDATFELEMQKEYQKLVDRLSLHCLSACAF